MRHFMSENFGVTFFLAESLKGDEPLRAGGRPDVSSVNSLRVESDDRHMPQAFGVESFNVKDAGGVGDCAAHAAHFDVDNMAAPLEFFPQTSQRRVQWLAFDVFCKDDAFDRLPTPQIFGREAIGNDVRSGRAVHARRILRLDGAPHQTEQHHQCNYPGDAFNPNRQVLLSETGSTDQYVTYSCSSGSPEWAARLVPVKGATFMASLPDLLLMSVSATRLTERDNTVID